MSSHSSSHRGEQLNRGDTRPRHCAHETDLVEPDMRNRWDSSVRSLGPRRSLNQKEPPVRYGEDAAASSPTPFRWVTPSPLARGPADNVFTRRVQLGHELYAGIGRQFERGRELGRRHRRLQHLYRARHVPAFLTSAATEARVRPRRSTPDPEPRATALSFVPPPVIDSKTMLSDRFRRPVDEYWLLMPERTEWGPLSV